MDIVKEISRIEKEADRIVEDARRQAKTLEAGLEDRLAPLRLKYEKEFETRAHEMRRRFREEIQQEESRLKEAFEDTQAHILQQERERTNDVVSFLMNRIREF